MEIKQRYYDWHAGDIGTLGELEYHLISYPEVLDLGCGTGWLARQIVQGGAKSVVGVDIDAGAIERMNQIGDERISGIVSPADDLPFPDESFDLVVAKDLIEHMHNVHATVSGIQRVLRPGGRVYIATPTPQSRNFWDDYTHVRPFTKRALGAVLQDAGLEVERVFYTGNYPLMGRYMRVMKRRRLPKIVHVLASARILRNNVHAWAVKR